MSKSEDGWLTKPSHWNDFDLDEYEDDILNTNLQQYDDYKYLIVLAGGLDHLGRNHPWVKDRLDVALRLYEKCERKIIILGGGTYHKPPHMNRANFVIHESTMGAKYLMDHGVTPGNIYREWASYDTIANAYFGFLNFIKPLELRHVLVITSDFHMERSKLLFDWMLKLFYLKKEKDPFKELEERESNPIPQLDYLEVSTKYLDSEIMQARFQREQRSALNVKQGLIPRIANLQEFHEWFYQEHQAYNCKFDVDKGEALDDKTRASY
jgi:hypothetical protein